jgi:hypothetical protein
LRPIRAHVDVVVALGTALLVTAGCSSLGGGPRPAPSSVGCARAAVAAVVTDEMTDKRKHCTGAASIARVCSVGEARLAAWGKEFTDIFDGGDPDVEDLRADDAGIECAQRDPDPARVLECCAAAGY